MKAADGVQIAESIRVAVREKVELITGWYEGDGRERERLEEACGQWAMAEERERVLREALEYYAAEMERNKFYIVTAHDRAFVSDFADWGGKAHAALTAAPEQGKEAKS